MTSTPSAPLLTLLAPALPFVCTQGFCGMSKCYFASNASKVGRSMQGELEAVPEAC